MSELNVAIAQITPVWLSRNKTLDKVVAWVDKAAENNCQLVAFAEALVPGYPFWVERTDGARFESPIQKSLYRQYVENAVDIEGGDLDVVCRAARRGGIAVYLGCIERVRNRGSSTYATLAFINRDGDIASTQRKLMPTHEERLVWAVGDGHGLRTHRIGDFTAGGLNCWENWMPLPRAALYAQGEDLHVAVWPGSQRNTYDITRYIAKESRSFVLSASSVFTSADVPDETPHRDQILAGGLGSLGSGAGDKDVWADGGSCIAGPDGEWVVEPQVGSEQLITATIDHARVLEARHSFNAAGHYSRPDVTRLTVDRTRQSTAEFQDEASTGQGERSDLES